VTRSAFGESTKAAKALAADARFVVFVSLRASVIQTPSCATRKGYAGVRLEEVGSLDHEAAK
jgi:hypothetical protein